MQHFNAKHMNQQHLHRLLLGSIAPRPIAFASTIDLHSNPNLAPFSFFNAFGVNPGTLLFSPSRRGRDNTTKHTLENLLEIPEVVINVVTYEMVQQMSLASCEYPKGVNEFVKAGFTAVPSETIRPFRVMESPVQFECKVRQIIHTGNGAGAGNLVICDILVVHVADNLLDENNELLHEKIDLVGRLGGDYYIRTNSLSRFTVPKPVSNTGIGIDALPGFIKNSQYLTGNDLGQLGNIEVFPSEDEITQFALSNEFESITQNNLQSLFEAAKKIIQNGRPKDALKLLLQHRN